MKGAFPPSAPHIPQVCLFFRRPWVYANQSLFAPRVTQTNSSSSSVQFPTPTPELGSPASHLWRKEMLSGGRQRRRTILLVSLAYPQIYVCGCSLTKCFTFLRAGRLSSLEVCQEAPEQTFSHGFPCVFNLPQGLLPPLSAHSQVQMGSFSSLPGQN